MAGGRVWLREGRREEGREGEREVRKVRERERERGEGTERLNDFWALVKVDSSDYLLRERKRV